MPVFLNLSGLLFNLAAFVIIFILIINLYMNKPAKVPVYLKILFVFIILLNIIYIFRQHPLKAHYLSRYYLLTDFVCMLSQSAALVLLMFKPGSNILSSKHALSLSLFKGSLISMALSLLAGVLFKLAFFMFPYLNFSLYNTFDKLCLYSDFVMMITSLTSILLIWMVGESVKCEANSTVNSNPGV